MLRPKRRSSPAFSALPAGLRAARCGCAASRSSLADTQADDDEGRGEHHGHQPRSTDAICGDAAEPRRPLGGAGRRGSRKGLTNRCKQSTFRLRLLLLRGGPRRLSELYTTSESLLPPRSAEPQASQRGGQAELSCAEIAQEVGVCLSSSQMQKWRRSFLSINNNQNPLAAAIVWIQRDQTAASNKTEWTRRQSRWRWRCEQRCALLAYHSVCML